MPLPADVKVCTFQRDVSFGFCEQVISEPEDEVLPKIAVSFRFFIELELMSWKLGGEYSNEKEMKKVCEAGSGFWKAQCWGSSRKCEPTFPI